MFIEKNTITETPMEKFRREDLEYMDAIRYAGHKLHKEPICCTDPANHKKMALFTGFYKICDICKSDLGDWM